MGKLHKKPKEPNKFIRFTSIAVQMGATIYLSNLLGSWVDLKTRNTEGVYVKVITLLGIFLAIYSVIRSVTKLSDND